MCLVSGSFWLHHSRYIDCCLEVHALGDTELMRPASFPRAAKGCAHRVLEFAGELAQLVLRVSLAGCPMPVAFEQSSH